MARLDRLLWDHLDQAAARQMSRVDEGHRLLAQARMALDNEASNGVMSHWAGYTSLQATTRSTGKLRFLTGMALAIARANGRDKTPRYQAAIGELTALVTIAEGIR